MTPFLPATLHPRRVEPCLGSASGLCLELTFYSKQHFANVICTICCYTQVRLPEMHVVAQISISSRFLSCLLIGLGRTSQLACGQLWAHIQKAQPTREQHILCGWIGMNNTRPAVGHNNLLSLALEAKQISDYLFCIRHQPQRWLFCKLTCENSRGVCVCVQKAEPTFV